MFLWAHLKRLFDIQHDDTEWKKLADKALAEYLNPEVGRAQPLEIETVEKQFEEFLARTHSAFGKVLSVEQNLVEKLQVMSQAKPLLVYRQVKFLVVMLTTRVLAPKVSCFCFFQPFYKEN